MGKNNTKLIIYSVGRNRNKLVVYSRGKRKINFIIYSWGKIVCYSLGGKKTSVSYSLSLGKNAKIIIYSLEKRKIRLVM